MSAGAEPRRVLVTGASRGIGRAVALRLAGPGATVLANHARDTGSMEALVAELERTGARAVAVRADALGEAGAAELAERAAAGAGGLDAVVHCAVEPAPGAAVDVTPEAMRASIERNGLSLLWLARACAPLMDDGGAMVFLTSRGSRAAVPGYAPLGVAKALGESLVRYLAVELAPRGIRVNAVSAGAVDTVSLRAMRPDADRILDAMGRRNPVGRPLSAGDVADAVALLVAPSARMVQGQVIQVDGGLELAS